jgi:uncharacterized membrane protein YvlD (DUF360 family)
MTFLIRLLVNAAALWVATRIVPGVTYTGEFLPFLAVALVFGIVNTFIGPVVKLLSLPLIILTLGIFALVVNGLMLWLTSARPWQSALKVVDPEQQEEAVARFSVVGISQRGMFVGTPLVKTEQDRSIGVDDLPEVVVGRGRLGQAK